MTVAPASAFITREEWDLAVADTLNQHFVRKTGRGVGPFRISPGFPPGARGPRRDVREQQCWAGHKGADGIPQVFINPILIEDMEVLTAIAHQMLHIQNGPGHQRGSSFHRAASAIGFEGSPGALEVGPELAAFFQELVDAVGPFSAVHSGFDLATRKTLPTGLKKIFCRNCGYTARASVKWAQMTADAHRFVCPMPPEQGGGGPGGPPPPQNPDEYDCTPQDSQQSQGGAGSSGSSSNSTDDGADEQDSSQSAGSNSAGSSSAGGGNQPPADTGSQRGGSSDDSAADRGDDGDSGAADDDDQPDTGSAGGPEDSTEDESAADDGDDGLQDEAAGESADDEPSAGDGGRSSGGPEEAADDAGSGDPGDSGVDGTDGGPDAGGTEDSAPVGSGRDDEGSAPEPGEAASPDASGDEDAEAGEDDEALDEGASVDSAGVPADADDAGEDGAGADDDGDIDADIGDGDDGLDWDSETGDEAELTDEEALNLSLPEDEDRLDDFSEDQDDDSFIGPNEGEAEVPVDVITADPEDEAPAPVSSGTYDEQQARPFINTVQYQTPTNQGVANMNTPKGTKAYYLSDADYMAGCPRCGSACSAKGCEICMREHHLCQSCEGQGFFLVNDVT